MPDEPMIIAVMPLEFCTERTAGAVDVKCSRCGTTCSAAPSTQEFIKVHPDAKMECLTCIIAKARKGEEIDLGGPVPGAVTEMAEHIGTDEADAQAKIEKANGALNRMLRGVQHPERN